MNPSKNILIFTALDKKLMALDKSFNSNFLLLIDYFNILRSTIKIGLKYSSLPY